MYKYLNSFIIGLGFFILIFSIIKIKNLLLILPETKKRSWQFLNKLIYLFAVGYLLTIVLLLLNYSFYLVLGVSVIFLFGAIFVLMVSIVSTEDVSFILQLNHNLQYEQHNWLATFNSITDIITVQDTDFNIIKANKAAEVFFKKKRQKIIGKKCYRLFHSDQKPYEKCMRKKLLETMSVQRSEFYEPALKKYIEIMQYPIIVDNKIERIIHVVRDLSPMKQEESAKNKYDFMLNSISDNISFIDNTYTYKAINNAFCKNMKYEREDIVGKKVSDIWGEDTFNNIIKEKIDDCLNDNIIRDRAWISFGQAESRFYDITYYPYKDEVTKIRSVVVLSKDITIEYLAEVEKEQLSKELLHAQKMEALGTLTGGIAHDFNNVLTSIIGRTDLLMEEEGIKAEAKDDILEIRNSASRATEMVKQLLVFSSKHPVMLTQIDLSKTIEDLQKMLKNILGENIKLSTELYEGEAMIEADKAQIQQVLMNLVVNAKDAMSEGGKIIIKTEYCIVDSPTLIQYGNVQEGEYFHLSVEDTGIGIDKDIIDNIFDPFFTTKSKGLGIGLGLSVMAGIIKNHKGGINVYSEEGRGTRFSIYLPKSDSSISIDRSSKKSHKELRGDQELVLLVEDDPAIRLVSKKMLEKSNYKVILASDMQKAIEKYRKNENISLVFCDMVLPDGNGIEVYEKMNSIRKVEKILFASGYLDGQSRWKELQENNLAFISKPYEKKILIQKIHELLKSD